MKKILRLFSALVLFTLLLSGSEVNATDNSEPQIVPEGQIVLKTINTLERKGYITQKNALEAKNELVFSNNEFITAVKTKQTIDKSDITWNEIITTSNVLKTLGLISFLFFFRGVILNFMFLFTKIPAWIYQILFLGGSLFATFGANYIWESQSFYISNFGVVANLIVLGWIVADYEEFFSKLFKLISLNIPAHIAVGFYAMIYFGFFAISLESSFMGILSVISFVSMLTFFMFSTGMSTYIGYDDEDYVTVSMFINGILLSIYSYIVIMGVEIPYMQYFSIGIEYVLTIAFGVALLINASFFSKDRPQFLFSFLLMFVAFFAGLAGLYLFNLEVIPVIMNTVFFLFALGWIGYISFQFSSLFAMLVVSCTLYGSGLLLEKHPELFVTALF